MSPSRLAMSSRSLSSSSPPLPPPPCKSRKVLIFDWDDTICPSTFVDSYKVDRHSDLPPRIRAVLAEIGRVAERCLAEASLHGDVLIITNSDDGWVHYSAERYVPSLLAVLHKYRIVSARTRYERFYPGQPLCWKAAAFAHEVNEIFASLAASESGALSGADTDVDSAAPAGAKDVQEEERGHTDATPGGDVAMEDSFDADGDQEALMMTMSTVTESSSSSCESMASTDESSSEDESSGDEAEPPSLSTRGPSDERDVKSSPSSSCSSSSSDHKNTSSHKHKREHRRPPSTTAQPQRRREVISFGDSMEERTAVRIVSRQLSSVSKSVMFLQGPTPIQIIGQLSMVADHMAYVCDADRSLDLEIGCDQASRSAEAHLRAVGRLELMRGVGTFSSAALAVARWQGEACEVDEGAQEDNRGADQEAMGEVGEGTRQAPPAREVERKSAVGSLRRGAGRVAARLVARE